MMEIDIQNDDTVDLVLQMSCFTVNTLWSNIMGGFSPCADPTATLLTKQNPEGVSYNRLVTLSCEVDIHALLHNGGQAAARLQTLETHVSVHWTWECLKRSQPPRKRFREPLG